METLCPLSLATISIKSHACLSCVFSVPISIHNNIIVPAVCIHCVCLNKSPANIAIIADLTKRFHKKKKIVINQSVQFDVQKLNILILKFMSVMVALKAQKRIAQGKA